jgi:HlyD family secretion protein
VVNYTVIIDVPNPDLKLLPGMTANITVLIQEEKDVLKVPSTALRFTPPQEYIDAYEKSLPDSVKKMREKWAKGEGRGRMGSGMGMGTGGGRGDGSGGGRGNGSGGGFMRQQAAASSAGMPAGGGDMQRRRGNFGQVWVKNGDTLRPVRVRTGISDGLNTEIKGRIREGEEVVLSIVSSQPTQTTQQQQQNPFAPQMQRPGGSSRGGR